MKFRFQINGNIDLQDESIGMKDVVSYLTKALEGGAAKITGITAFEMKQKNVPTGRKKRPYIPLANRVTDEQ